ncbi:MAG: tetratricopeptide repeat protein [Bacteroidota bacterium]|nr:tetratricopeptide repeat protein [Bacteroidota bacterium]MDP3144288.1 tetratricopeptide repeat protein [Bacteroidota bacterium]MDP3556274.1 tetratricopeptide repeat protein [Bacteroidota bacterium]
MVSKQLLVIILFVLFFANIHAQSIFEADSIRKLIKADKEDTNKVNHLNTLVDDLQFVWAVSEPLINEQIQLSRKLNFWRGQAKAYLQFSWCYNLISDYKKATNYCDSAMMILKKNNYKLGIGSVLITKGGIVGKIGATDEAYRLYTEALTIFENEESERGVAAALINIANIQNNQGDIDKATANMKRALAINLKLKNLKSQGICYSNLGNYQNKKGQADSAIYFYRKALNIKLIQGDVRGEAASYGRISGVHEQNGNMDSAILYTNKELKLFEGLKDKSNLSKTMISVGFLNLKSSKVEQAINICNTALVIGEEIGEQSIKRDACECLAQAYAAKKDGLKAYKYLSLFIQFKDSLSNSDIDKQIARTEVSYKYEKEILADSIRTAENQKGMLAREQQKLEKQRVIAIAGIVGFLLALLLAIVFYKSAKQKSRDNSLLEEKNTIIEEHRSILELKNREILDSIKYAKRIQMAILPNENYIERNLKKLNPSDKK